MADEDRTYVVGVLVGPDGTNEVKVLRHPSGERIYSSGVIGGDEAGFRLSMERATDAVWNDVRDPGSAAPPRQRLSTNEEDR